MIKKLAAVFLLAVMVHFMIPNRVYGDSKELNLWTIAVNPKLGNRSPGIYGLWKSSEAPSSKLFFGIFDERIVLEKALSTVKELDPTATPEIISPKIKPFFVPVRKKISLAELGYRAPFQIRGVRGWSSIHIPWNKASILRESKAIVYIKYPFGLFQRPSTLTILVENVPVKVLPLDQPPPSPLIVPLEIPEEVEIGDFLDISFATSITITGDICADEKTGNSWVSIEPSSFFEIAYSPTLQSSFFDILRHPASRFNVILSEKPSTEELTGVVNLASFIGALNHYNRDRLVTLSEKYSLNYPNIIVNPEEKDGKVFNRDIIVSPKGLLNLGEMLKKIPLPLFQWKDVKVEQGSRKSEIAVTFSDIGVSPPTLKGMGELKFSLPFTTASFGVFPSKLIVTLIYSHTPVTRDERAFLKASLNNVLVASKMLTGSAGEESFSFELPHRLLQTRNTLDVIFSYFTNRGECKGSMPEMEVSIFPNSFFSIVGRSTTDIDKFDRFPGFLEGRGIMVIGDTSPPFIELAVGLSEKLGKIRRMPFYVDVIDLDKLRAEDPATSFLIAVLRASQSGVLKPPVNLSEKFLIQNPQTEEVFLQVETLDNVAVWEVFQNRDRPVGLFAISDALADSKLVNPILESLRIEGSANVAVWIANSLATEKDSLLASSWRYFEVGDKMKVITPTKKGFSYYWTRYRIAFFLLAGVLVFVFLWYVYKKLT